MIELEPTPIDLTLSLEAVEYEISLLRKHKDDTMTFFVVFYPPYMVFARDWTQQKVGALPVFFVPKDNLPNQDDWDLVMYSSLNGDAIARQANRPK